MTTPDAAIRIQGESAVEIADSVRALIERETFAPGDALPPVRTLASALGVNRNTVVSAYRHLAQAGLVTSHGRGGTLVARRAPLAQDGFSPDTVLRDVGSGNPDPALIPPIADVLGAIAGRPVLYGEPVIDAALEQWSTQWIREAVGDDRDARLTITSGAVDAVERLLAQALTRDDAVALEDPCFLASIQTVRLGGYRAVPVAVDAEGMTVDGLRAALEAGVRAIVCTPRAQNPTGASLSPARASALRAVLADHPYVLVIEDDHFSLLASTPYRSIIPPGHQRWALVRSVSKFLGPDMCMAIAATDPDTARRLAMRLSPGTTWVSHLLQRLAHAQLTDAGALTTIESARTHYAARNRAFAERLRARGVAVTVGDGLNLWLALPVAARAVSEQLMRRGWLARTGDEFVLADAATTRHLRLTVHELDDAEADRFAADIAAALDAVAMQKVG
ncbi:aminotransferase class I/II-fold pyridoxal phosphate-dependent enzyme [Microbacterium sp. NPDC089189]|uniref:aminotransferase class I/II-fold pyridoxal phosphate-dependent enzyme n=1 Tax=Microbacterium sp. NPDC089189 TaxID=3154972 RepID=UPI00342B2BEE